ncbi:hypothetical protein [Clostridium sp. FP1]|uniref:hypothetical protein n=1 Tax=Clostridium sp. FP1 TaxID=2724076 RepID=UPI0013E92BF1|nr:hypothetical protein [Clostridium sp. FP1]MBZ9637410.1 hypothetical protein [Clostridium sp. FP1]
MILDKNQVIKWECNNWYLREDNFIQICTQNGGNVILNKTIAKIWISIDYETSIEELWNKVRSIVSWEELSSAVEQLHLYNLVQLVDVENEFDSIFG